MSGRLLLVGAGQMGGALLAGLRRTNIALDILVVDPRPPAGRERSVPRLSDVGGFRPDLIVLAVKPTLIEAIAPDLRARLAGETAVISFLAGVRAARLRALLGEGAAPIRVMPNLPLSVGLGVSGLYAPPDTPDRAVDQATELLEHCGEVVRVAREEDLDAVTAISGSGPAYVFRFAEALTAAAVDLGLPPQVAELLARQTVIGAGAQMANDPSPLATLRDRVTSPGGTTAKALEVFGAPRGLDDLVRRAAKAAASRAQALGDAA
jgi:pyrroline-5-carboxylate reductase